MKIAKLISFYVDSFSALGFDYKVFVIETRLSPEVLLQLLAFCGTAHIDGKDHLNIDNWKAVPAEVMHEFRMTLFTSYRSLKEGRLQSGPNGMYTLKSVSTKATVEPGGVISLPDFREAEMHATNRRCARLIG